MVPPSKDNDDGNYEIEENSLKMYPERRGESKTSLWSRPLAVFKCEKNVANCVENYPLVKHMMSALRAAGCEFDIRRNISCEYCTAEVTGGYDPRMNQIVVCHNHLRTSGMISGVLSHEMLHMFDYCRAKFDFDNIEHVACSEIRAANLMHCSFTSAWIQGAASPFNFKRAHRICVKAKAMESILAVRPDMPREEAWNVIDKVFDKCYNDLEPIGRRVKANSNDIERAYRERRHYGYI